MRRREFITLLGGAAAWPLAARAQQPAMPVIGFLGGETPDRYADRLRGFRQGLSETGYVEGRNVQVEYRWAEDRNDRLPALAADLVRRRVNVIVTGGGSPAALAAKAASTTIPVVFQVGNDPVQLGLVASLNRPGANLTGVNSLNGELGPKQLELLHELVPTAANLAALSNPTNPGNTAASKTLEAAARTLGLQLYVLHASSERDFDTVFATLSQLRAGGLVIIADPFLQSRSEQLAALALRHALPAIAQLREFVAAGGAMSYGGSIREQLRPGRPLHRPDSQGRETGRPAGPAVHQSRADHQPQDRQGARPHRPARAGRQRRRADRMRRISGLCASAKRCRNVGDRAKQDERIVL
jgi:putative tryptophan/tyrosine transport system substrate-binding protein